MKAAQWDVVIAGGGPAGTSAAITLAQQGLKVALFESGSYPHDKMCGEFLSPECAGMLDLLGAKDLVQRYGPVSIQASRLTAPNGTAWESPLPGNAWGISRRVLDAALAEQAVRAGTAVFEGSTLDHVSGNLEDGFVLGVTSRDTQTPQGLRARAVIGAHGKRSRLDRVLGRRFLKKQHPYVAIKAHFHGPPIPGRIELHGFPGGYCGISEIEGGASVLCLLVKEPVLRAHRQPGSNGIEPFVDWMKEQNPYLQIWLDQAQRIHRQWITIAQVAFDRKPAVEQDVLMAGDAAGLITPLAGNGIAMALAGGTLAGTYITRFLCGEMSAAELRRAYPAAWNRRFSARLRLGRLLQPLLLRPWSAALALRLLNHLPAAGRYLINHTRETDPR